uniref:Uncharacterized protein n=1 Tax=Ananas comosus var. bracteatus TaxID=296719 RepID=A0A6V7NL15_ANACO|nr:unnamed protein product [Ananas comosus var. bracteatus]
MPCWWSAVWPGQAKSTAHAAEAVALEMVRKRAPRTASATTHNWKSSLVAISERSVLPPQPRVQEAAKKRRGGMKKRRIRSAASHTDGDYFRHYGVPIPPTAPSFPPTTFLF